MTGMMGADWGPASIITQLHGRGEINCYSSYRLPSFGQDISGPPSTFLRFGDDGPQKTGPFYKKFGEVP